MSMFPHKITLIKKSDYSVTKVSGVYWSGSHSRNQNGKGVDVGNAINVYMPLDKDIFQVGDMLIKGDVNLPVITSVAQLEDYDYVTVVSKQVHDVGSNIDNVILSCQ